MRQAIVSSALGAAMLAALSLAHPSSDRQMYERVAGAAIARGGAYEFLQRLTDEVGGRPTGSESARAAADLLLETLTRSGLENVHAEEYPLLSRWRRGTAAARVVSPAVRPLVVQSFGWSPGTDGSIEAAMVDAGTVRHGTSLPSGVANAIVLADFPGDADE